MRVMTGLLLRWGRFALACAGVLGLAITTLTSAALAEVTSPPPAAGGSAGQLLWVAQGNDASSTAVAASPTGGAVFVTGYGGTIGYDAATGAQLWVSQYNGPAQLGGFADAVSVSPDGSRVFVTGDTVDAHGDLEYATVAYDASMGTRLWASVHAAHATLGVARAVARAIVVSPDGKVVYITGYSGQARGGAYDYLTIAYNARTGAAPWNKRYGFSLAAAISPDGRTLYVTGVSDPDPATIAYRA